MPKRPTRLFMGACSSKVSGRPGVRKPGAICAAAWENMTPAERRAWARLERPKTKKRRNRAKRKK